MILYLDSSALVKRYIIELGSKELEEIIRRSDVVGTGIISRAEVSSALAKAVRVGTLNNKEAIEALNAFHKDWQDLIRVAVSESVVARADELAWQYGLRGYDAVQLALALVWQEVLGDVVTFATFDKQLAAAAEAAGLVPFPGDLSTFRDHRSR